MFDDDIVLVKLQATKQRLHCPRNGSHEIVPFKLEALQLLEVPKVVDTFKGCFGFKYSNSLGRQYEDTKKVVTSVRFATSRYGKYSYTAEFKVPVTEKHAIKDVEKFLSQPMTQDYLNDINDDLFVGCKSQLTDFSCRGDALSDARFLEQIKFKDGKITFSTGS